MNSLILDDLYYVRRDLMAISDILFALSIDEPKQKINNSIAVDGFLSDVLYKEAEKIEHIHKIISDDIEKAPI